jgi:D-proline reductase (dithiol) PrdB
MVRLADLPDWEREHLLEKARDAPRFDARPWVEGPTLARRRVAIVTTSGMHRRNDRPFGLIPGTDYRVIPGDARADDLMMSHISVNFDRGGFQQDVNVVFPIDRLRELVEDGVIASVADFHYAFMGAAWPPTRFEPKAQELAVLLRKDRVDAVLLSPV